MDPLATAWSIGPPESMDASLLKRLHTTARGKRELPGGLSVNYGNLPSYSDEFAKLHTHELPYLSLLVHGDCRETVSGQGARDLAAWRPTFHPAGEAHLRTTSHRGYGVFGVELSPRLIEEAELSLPERLVDLNASDLSLKRFAYQFTLGGSISTLRMGALALDLLATLQEADRPEAAIPRWLGRSRDLLHSNPWLSVAELAREVSVSPSHLTREFTARYGAPPAKFAHGRIMEMAESDLIYSDLSIAALAQKLGFCDESHFIRSFKRRCGLTPGQFRQRKR